MLTPVSYYQVTQFLPITNVGNQLETSAVVRLVLSFLLVIQLVTNVMMILMDGNLNIAKYQGHLFTLD